MNLHVSALNISFCSSSRSWECQEQQQQQQWTDTLTELLANTSPLLWKPTSSMANWVRTNIDIWIKSMYSAFWNCDLMVFIFLDEANIPVLRKRKYFIGPCYTVIVFCCYSIVSLWKFFPGLHHNLGWDSSRLWLCLKQLTQFSIRGWYKRGTAFSSRIESNLILLNEEENYLLFF